MDRVSTFSLEEEPLCHVQCKQNFAVVFVWKLCVVKEECVEVMLKGADCGGFVFC